MSRVPVQIQKMMEDPRVFSSRGMVIFDPDTGEVIHTIKPIPRGMDVDNLKLTFTGMSIDTFEGDVPECARKKFVGGKFFPMRNPQMRVKLNSPYLCPDPFDADNIVPCIVAGTEYLLIVECSTEDGLVYRHKGDEFVVRLTSTAGLLSKVYYKKFPGKGKIKFSSEGVPQNSVLTIQVLSKLLPPAEIRIVVI